MALINDWLHEFVAQKISTDKSWQQIEFIVDDSSVPGEGEHKILDFMRFLKTCKDYNPNQYHCIYRRDSDLIMLGLITQEPNLHILREDPYLVRCYNQLLN